MSQKLPAWKIAKKSISLIFRDFVIALRAMWLTVLAVVLINYYYQDLQNWVLKNEWGANSDIAGVIVLFFLILVTSILGAFASVFWHRSILFQEKKIPLIPLRFKNYNMRYLVINLLLSLGALAALTILTAIGAFVLRDKDLLKLASLIMAAPVFFYMYRFSIILLPAAATNNKQNGSLENAEMLTSSQIGPIMFLTFLWCLFFAVMLVITTLPLAFFKAQPVIAHHLYIMTLALMTFFTTLFSVGLTAIPYAFLTHNQNPQEATSPEGA